MNDSAGSVIGLILIGLLGLWAYNHYTTKQITDDYGYTVPTSGITQKPDCGTLAPSNPYDYGSGHYAGFEWGEQGNACGGNSSSFIEGCKEYENQESAYQYCLSR